MYLVERHFINEKHKDFKEIDDLAFRSKNLYNYALYTIRQHYFQTRFYINYNELNKQLQSHEAYKALPSKVSQQVLIKLHKNWLSYFEALKAYKIDPSKFYAKPKIPRYKDKIKGRNLLTYNNQAIGKNNKQLSKTNITINTTKIVQEVRIVPKTFGYYIEVVYNTEEAKQFRKNKKFASIDIGVNNLVAITSNSAKALLVNGRPLKSINQHFNKQMSNPKLGEKRRHMLCAKRYHRIQNYLHNTSCLIIKYCLKHNIRTLVVGHNEGIKQELKLRKDSKQNFVYIPFLDLIKQIDYKGAINGIKVIKTEEAHTSKASYYDKDPLPKFDVPVEYSGSRVKRGLYKSKDGTALNADLNGSLNIGRKVIHDYVVDRSLVARPVKVNPLRTDYCSLL